MTAPATRQYLLAHARCSLRDALEAELGAVGLEAPVLDRPNDPALGEPARVFVSWHDGPALVGCIGTLEPAARLEDAVARYAVHAGLHDRRTPAPDPQRWDELTCEVSILGEPRALSQSGLDAIADALVPGREGVILTCGEKRAFFLPVVWDKLPDPRDFLWALCRKAGASLDVARVHARAEVLEVEAFGEGST